MSQSVIFNQEQSTQLPAEPSVNLVTARNSSCGKVMFSQACVIPSVYGGVCLGGSARGSASPHGHFGPFPLPHGHLGLLYFMTC